MAEVRPNRLSSDIIKDPLRSAEIKFYNICQQLPSHIFVLYSVTWVAQLSQNRPASDGEVDFVLIGPDIGIVVIEVKGGGIGRDEDGWYSVNRYGVRKRINDPIKQAIHGKYNLIRFIKNDQRFSRKYLPAAHMICFPNIRKADLPKLPDLPSEIAITSEDFDSLIDRLHVGVQFFYPDNKFPSLTHDDCSNIADILKPDFEMPSRWATIAKLQEAIFENLTDEQKGVLSAFDGNRFIAVTGPAGSGKTVVVIRWALDHGLKGKSILVLVPNRLLRNYYAEMLKNVSRYQVLSYLSGEQCKLLNSTNYDIVIVDEAQDMPIELWDLIEKMANCCSHLKLIVIYDSNQKILSKNSFYLPDNLAEVRLRNVIRNTRQIAKMSSLFYQNDEVEFKCVGPEGPNVVEIPISNRLEIPVKVSEYILALVNKEGFSFRDIVVLFGLRGGTLLRQRIHQNQEVEYRGQTFWETGNEDAVAVMSVKKFRGLESPIVILTEVDELLDYQLLEACYVGISRAKYHLVIVGLSGTLQKIKNWNIK